MEGLTTGGNYSEDLLSQVRRLTSSALSLSAMFAEEASRLSRQDEASQLKTLNLSIRRQLERIKSSENAASYGRGQRELLIILGGLAVSRVIRMISKDKQLAALTDSIFTSPASRECPFGMVMVCIGPPGLPDDVEVISISQLARESNRPESAVINILQERGYLLIDEQAFSLLIDRLIDDVLQGQLRLPISMEKLSEIVSSGGLKSEADNQ